MSPVQPGRVRSLAPLLLQGGLGALLLVAGVLKVSESAELAETLALFRLLPAAANRMLAIGLPWWEITTGTFLLLGLWGRAALLLSTGLFALFALAVGIALARGLVVDCGCFGVAFRMPVSGLHLGANIAFALLSGGLLVRSVRARAGPSPSFAPAGRSAEEQEGPAPRLLAGGGDPWRR